MILPILLPMMGSMLAPSMFGALGMSAVPAWLAAGVGSGLGTLAATRDPEQALLSALTAGAGAGLGAVATGAAGAAGGAGGAASSAGTAGAVKGAADVVLQKGVQEAAVKAATQATTQQAAQQAATKAVLSNMAKVAGPGVVKPVVTPTVGAAVSPKAPRVDAGHMQALSKSKPVGMGLGALATKPTTVTPAATGAGAAGEGGMFGGMDMNQLAMMAMMGMGGGGGYYDNSPKEQDYSRTPYTYGASGPVYGVSHMPTIGEPGSMTLEDYLNYGQSGGSHPSERDFFAGSEDWETSAPIPIQGGAPTGGGSSGQGGWNPREQTFGEYLRERGEKGYAKGGRVKGPGSKGRYIKGGPPGRDMIQGVVDGKLPVRLDSGEYVFSKRAVRAAGGPKAMDRIHNRLKDMADGRGKRGRKRASVRSHRAAA